MRKKRNNARAAKIRAMISQGYTTTDICEKLRVRPQAVYNIRWHMKRSLGLGALPLPVAPTPTATPIVPDTVTYTSTSAAPNAALMPVPMPVLQPRAQTPAQTPAQTAIQTPTPKLPFWRRVLAVVALR